MSRKVSIATCVLVSTVALGVAVNAGARAAGSLVQVGQPAITHNGELTFGNGTWTASASGADFDKPDPGGWAGHYTWTIPREIPAGGADAQLIVTAEGRGARHNACAKLVLSGIAISGGPAGNQLCTLAEVGRTESNTASFRLTPQSTSGSIEIQMQDGPQVHFNYAAPPGGGDPCASKIACESETVAVPDPGESGTVKGPLSRGAGRSLVTATAELAEGFRDTPIVGEGSVEDKKKGTKGEQIAACWLLGPGALVADPDEVANILGGSDSQALQSLAKQFKRFDSGGGTPEENLGFCIVLVQILAAVQAENPPSARRPAASGCAQEIVITGQAKNGKLQLKPAKPTALPRTQVNYSCSETGDGELQITAKSSNKKGLRGELGKQLDLGVVRPPDAPATDATLTFGFSS